MSGTITKNPLEAIFSRYDGDGDGMMNRKEFFVFLFQLGRKDLTKEKMEACWKYITDNENFVDFDEFSSGVPKLYKINFNAETALKEKLDKLTQGPKATLEAFDAAQGFNPNIRHVVVMTLPNRSFDHVFGYLNQVRMVSGGDPVDGLNGTEENKTADGVSIPVHSNASYTPWTVSSTIGNCFYQVNSTPPVDGYQSTASMMDSMQGFVKLFDLYNSNEKNRADVMGSLGPDKLPVLTTLANEFGISDCWFSSLPGPTIPNRCFLLSGTSDGDATNNLEKVLAGYSQTSLFQSLSEAEISWKNYYEQGTTPSALLFRWCRKKAIGHLAHLNDFYEDARQGKLPQFSFIDLKDQGITRACDEQEKELVMAADYLKAERAVKSVYDTLRLAPQWNNTVLLITCDSAGGFYDHVTPPGQAYEGIPSPDGKEAFDSKYVYQFNTLGARVPTIIVSPWITKGRVIRPTTASTLGFDHTCLLSTLAHQFKLNHLTERDRWAASIHSFFSEMKEPRNDCPLSMPRPLDSAEKANETADKLENENVYINSLLKVLKPKSDSISSKENLAI